MFVIKSSPFIILYTFFFLYFPPILPFNILHILTILSLLMIGVFYRQEMLQTLFQSHLLNFSLLLAVAILYLTIVVLFSNNDLLTIYPYLLILIEIPVCVLYLNIYFAKNKYKIVNILNLLLIAGLFQCLISIVAFYNSSFKDFLLELMAKRFQDTDVQAVASLYSLSEVRLNGLSSSMTFTTPMIQSILGLVSLKMALVLNWKYALIVPLFVFSAVINARNSFVVLGGGLLILLVSSMMAGKNFGKLIAVLFISVILMQFVDELIAEDSEQVYVWASAGIDQIISFFHGEREGYFVALFDYFISFPDGIFLLIGTGKSIFGSAIGEISDVGYVNDIWLGGIIFVIPLYFSFMNYYWKAYKDNDDLGRFIVIIIFFTFFTANIKGSVVSNNDFLNLSLLLSTVYILRNKYGGFK